MLTLTCNQHHVDVDYYPSQEVKGHTVYIHIYVYIRHTRILLYDTQEFRGNGETFLRGTFL